MLTESFIELQTLALLNISRFVSLTFGCFDFGHCIFLSSDQYKIKNPPKKQSFARPTRAEKLYKKENKDLQKTFQEYCPPNQNNAKSKQRFLPFFVCFLDFS